MDPGIWQKLASLRYVLVTIMKKVIPMHATDLRGKVYGILGLVDSPLKPHYSQPVEDIFYEFALFVRIQVINKSMVNGKLSLEDVGALDKEQSCI